MAEGQGGNAESALRDLIANSIRSGGLESNDPGARAVTRASQLGGNLVNNLVSMGRGDIGADKIAAIQKQAERRGWTDQDRQMIKEMRQYQTDAQRDANAMKQITFNRSGGAGSAGAMAGGGQGVVKMDELGILAQLIGKYAGNMDETMASGSNSQRKSAILGQDQQMLAALGPMYEELMKQKKSETALMRDKELESQLNLLRMRGQNDPMRIAREQNSNSERPSMAYSFNQSNGSGLPRRKYNPYRNRQEQEDPYKNVRDQAIQAALAYINKSNPHRISSL